MENESLLEDMDDSGMAESYSSHIVTISFSTCIIKFRLELFQITVVVFWFLVSPYVKSYAMLFIHDDAFLAQVAFLQNMMSGSSKLIFGILFDKWGFKVGFYTSIKEIQPCHSMCQARSC